MSLTGGQEQRYVKFMAQLEETETQLVTQKTDNDSKIDDLNRRVEERKVRQQPM